MYAICVSGNGVSGEVSTLWHRGGGGVTGVRILPVDYVCEVEKVMMREER